MNVFEHPGKTIRSHLWFEAPPGMSDVQCSHGAVHGHTSAAAQTSLTTCPALLHVLALTTLHHLPSTWPIRIAGTRVLRCGVCAASCASRHSLQVELVGAALPAVRAGVLCTVAAGIHRIHFGCSKGGLEHGPPPDAGGQGRRVCHAAESCGPAAHGAVFVHGVVHHCCLRHWLGGRLECEWCPWR